MKPPRTTHSQAGEAIYQPRRHITQLKDATVVDAPDSLCWGKGLALGTRHRADETSLGTF